MEFGIVLHPTDSPAEQARLTRLSEKLGFSMAGMGDSQLLWDDVYVDLSLAAAKTTKIKLGTWVTNLQTRHPSVTARAISTLDRSSGGRAFLGIGAGDSSLYSMGQKPPTLPECKVRLDLIKRYLAGEERFAGSRARVVMPHTGEIPIYWAARGLKSMEFAGENADGVIVGGWADPGVLKASLEAVKKGAERAATQRRNPRVILHVAFAVGDNPSRAKEMVKPFVARAMRDLPKKLWNLFPKDVIETVEKVNEAYVYAHHLSQEHTEVTDLVSDRIVDAFSICGSPDQCVRKVKEMRRCGVSDIFFMPLASREKQITDLWRKVLATL